LPSPVIQHGPALHVLGDGVHPTKFEWDFDPPVVLPHRGLYAFFLQGPIDECPTFFDVLTRDGGDAYPEGHYWRGGRTDYCTLRFNPDPIPDSDIVFTIEFCHEESTPVRNSTWGRVKTLYR